MVKPDPVSAAPKKDLKEPKVVPQRPSNIEYIGVGAEKVKFTVDPRAKNIRVYADGRILVDY